MMKKFSVLSVSTLLLLLINACDNQATLPNNETVSQKQESIVIASKKQNNTDADFKEAFKQQRSGIMLEGAGIITTLLRDDDEGARHQRFIVTLASGQSLLIAHNIDLAPRIHHLKKGDNISFYGQYEWNKKGGTIHWTHKDPQNRHTDGWLKYQGKIYQ